MPSINRNASEESNPNENPSEHIHELLMNSDVPAVACGVNRRVNLGNFEHIDIYTGVKLPIGLNIDDIIDKLSSTVDDAMKVASKETHDRYMLIKEAQDTGRPKRPDDNQEA